MGSTWNNDYRISTYRALHRLQLDANRRPVLMPSFSTSAKDIFSTLDYTYVFSTGSLERLTLNGKWLTDGTYSGTLAPGETHSLPLYHRASEVVNYTLTFTDYSGGTTVYTGSFNFADIRPFQQG